MNPWLRYMVAALATWRVTHLLANEDGPADLLARTRRRLGHGFLGTLMSCFYCLSLWVAAPMALLVAWNVLDVLLSAVALSGAACLLERATEQPIQFQPASNEVEGGDGDGMLLRSDSGDSRGTPASEVDLDRPPGKLVR